MKAFIKSLLSIIILLLSLFIIVIGLHGLYVHFEKNNFIMNSMTPISPLDEHGYPTLNVFNDILNSIYNPHYQGLDKLFGIIRMPDVLGTVTIKMTTWSLESLFMPLTFTIGGILLYLNRRRLVHSLINIL